MRPERGEELMQTDDPTSTRDSARMVAAQVPTELLIAGDWKPATGGGTFTVHDPATFEPIAEVADAQPADGRAALDAAVAAAAAWAATPTSERAAILRRVAALMTSHSQELAFLITYEMGKPLAESRQEVSYAAEYFDWFAEETVRIDGSLGPARTGAWTIAISHEPVGPCVLVTPWNFPAAMPARKLAPALAAGCTTVLKPADLTPLTALAIGELLIEAGTPAGVVNIVPTSTPGPVIAPLLNDVRTRKLSFTGSSSVGKLLMAQAADNVLRLSLELGGNAPFIVCSDADLDAAIDGAVRAKMRNNGEACTAANRFYVDSAVSEEFTERLAERLCGMTVGHGLDEGVEVGPLIDARATEKAQRVIDQCTADGARKLTGSAPPPGLGGAFCPPTVLADVPAHSRALLEEVFAPVAPIVTVPDAVEALRLANDTPFGLVAYVYTRDLARARSLTAGLQTGMVGLNTGIVSTVTAPFGGRKWSGMGREGGREGLEAFQELKYIAAA
jgi:succinate-semialdehyde dehydrogenase / glutarate-semialdehyde dehydrogenase